VGSKYLEEEGEPARSFLVLNDHDLYDCDLTL
jgi:hypothetical protein